MMGQADRRTDQGPSRQASALGDDSHPAAVARVKARLGIAVGADNVAAVAGAERRGVRARHRCRVLEGGARARGGRCPLAPRTLGVSDRRRSHHGPARGDPRPARVAVRPGDAEYALQHRLRHRQFSRRGSGARGTSRSRAGSSRRSAASSSSRKAHGYRDGALGLRSGLRLRHPGGARRRGCGARPAPADGDRDGGADGLRRHFDGARHRPPPRGAQGRRDDPAGCTIAGILALEDGRIRSVLSRAVEVASVRAGELASGR